MITTAVMNHKLHRIISRHITPFTYHIMVTLSKRLSNGLTNRPRALSVAEVSTAFVPAPPFHHPTVVEPQPSLHRHQIRGFLLVFPTYAPRLLVMSSSPWLADHSVISSKRNLPPNYKFVLFSQRSAYYNFSFVAVKHCKLHFLNADFLCNIPIHLFVNASKTASS